MNNKKYTIEAVRQYFKAQGCELLEETYKNIGTPLKYKCNCGNLSKSSFDNFKRGKRCKDCGIHKNALLKRNPFSKIKQDCEVRGLKLLTTEQEYLSFPLGLRENNQKIVVECKNNHIINRSLSNLTQHQNKFGECKECFYLRNRGEGHHWFINGSTSDYLLGRERCLTINLEWKKAVYEKDNWKCVICSGSKNIVAHHLDGYNWDVENRYNISNGITLCLLHHTNFHQIYGRGFNTARQFNEYSSIIKQNQFILDLPIGVPLLILPERRNFLAPGNYLLN